MLAQSKNLGLQEGIKVFCFPDTDTQSPIVWLSSGTTQEIEPVPEDIGYSPGAFVPKEPWRQPNLREYNLLCADQPISNNRTWELGSYIGVCRFPDEVLAPLEVILEELGTRARATIQDYQPIPTHPGYESAITEIANYLPRYCLFSDRPKILNVRVTQPGLKTATRDYCNNLPGMPYTGMHLDSWDRFPLRRRHKSRNRICINLGREERFFLFINLTLMEMFNALGLSDPDDIYKHYRGTNIGDEFMKQFPSYPVVKLRIGPKEAYIAPTDNLIHDASSLGKKYPDITLTCIGYFGSALD
ncbi:MAG: hypothetical protein KME08_00745 [Aphanothece sp. CMT-3BRIN-NPC111]|jgi:hypothetical protein|nr:hypothetical protein [Aphanothece sp. CMT-3BRIN-NPC111]